MEQDSITFISYLSGSVMFMALSLVFFYLWVQQRCHPALLVAALLSLLWHSALSANYQGSIMLTRDWLLILEISRYGGWIMAILACLKFASGQNLSRKIHWLGNGIWLGMLGIALAAALTGATWLTSTDLLIWVGLSLSILGLVCVEQLFRNTSESRQIKLLSVTIAALFGYDIYLYSHSLIFNQIDQGLWQARGAINAFVALIMALGSLATAHQSAPQASVSISRPVVFYTTSLTAAGLFLTLMAIGGYYVQIWGGRWGAIVQVTLLFLALLSILVVFVSKTVQSRLSVWINKNFFRHKYDYRVEWLRLINSLSKPTNDGDFHRRALETIASIFRSPGGALWLRQGNQYKPVSQINISLPDTDLELPAEQPFCQALRENEWVFSPYSPENERLSDLNELLPEWIYAIQKIWLVVPLLTESDLIGFIVLTEPNSDTSLTWEDLDLLKTVGRQVASYLEKHEAAELLAEARQFDAFNKLTAFIMHDLKNLIAQQALVVENAAKHKENPAFVEDAIRTIENSVNRMSNLLRKLQRDEPSEYRSLDLHKVLMEAVKKCQDLKPVPSLRLEHNDISVNADIDRLVMTLMHLIKNAQEATSNTGFIDVTLRRDGNNAIITVEDNGTGMDEAFIRSQLFKPFVTTKSGKGMGIGVYQTKEYIASLGGNVTVHSQPDVGTTFTISIPTNQAVESL